MVTPCGLSSFVPQIMGLLPQCVGFQVLIGRVLICDDYAKTPGCPKCVYLVKTHTRYRE